MGGTDSRKGDRMEDISEITNDTEASEYRSHTSGSETADSGKEEFESTEVTEVETGVSQRSGPITRAELLVERNYERFLERQQGTWDPELPKSKTATMAISSDWNVQPLTDETTTGPPRTKTAPSVLLEQALRIRVQGSVLRGVAGHNCKVLMMGTGNLNYNAFILSMTAKLPTGNIIAVDDAENRARAVLARKMGLNASEVLNVAIWGDPTGLYDIPPGCVVTCPVYLGKESWAPVPNLELPPSLATKIQRSIQKCTHTQVLSKLRFLQEDAQFELEASSAEEDDPGTGVTPKGRKGRSNASSIVVSLTSSDVDEDTFQ